MHYNYIAMLRCDITHAGPREDPLRAVKACPGVFSLVLYLILKCYLLKHCSSYSSTFLSQQISIIKQINQLISSLGGPSLRNKLIT